MEEERDKDDWNVRVHSDRCVCVWGGRLSQAWKSVGKVKDSQHPFSHIFLGLLLPQVQSTLISISLYSCLNAHCITSIPMRWALFSLTACLYFVYQVVHTYLLCIFFVITSPLHPKSMHAFVVCIQTSYTPWNKPISIIALWPLPGFSLLFFQNTPAPLLIRSI